MTDNREMLQRSPVRTARFFAVPKGVPKLTNEVTLRAIWSISADVSGIA